MSSCLFDSRVPSDTRAKADLGVGPRGPCYFGQEKTAEGKKPAGQAKNHYLLPLAHGQDLPLLEPG